jgi:hypothetical protein
MFIGFEDPQTGIVPGFVFVLRLYPEAVEYLE